MKLYVPKIICLISSCPVLEFQKQFLAFFYKFTITSKLNKQAPKLKIYQYLYDKFSQLVSEEGPFNIAEQKWDDQIYQTTLNLIKNQTNESDITKQFSLREEFLVNFSVSMLFRVHTLQKIQNKNTEIVFHLSNDEVCRLRPLSQIFSSFFTLNNFSFRPFFEKISINTTITLLQSILLERQILLVSSNPNDIISICESLFTLIYPLKWACIYIPLLPLQLSDMIQALMPFIIGINKKNFEEIKQRIDLKDKVVIDLDVDIVQQTEIYKLPDYLSNYLQNNIKQLYKKFIEAQNEEQKKKNTWIEVIFQLKKIFLTFMTCLINNFTPYFLYSNKFDKENVVSREIFAKLDYLQIFESNEKSFLNEFCQNTMVNKLFNVLLTISSNNFFIIQKSFPIIYRLSQIHKFLNQLKLKCKMDYFNMQYFSSYCRNNKYKNIFEYQKQMFSKFLEDSYKILYMTEYKKEDIDIINDDKEGLYFFLKNIKKIQKCLPKSNTEKKFDLVQNPFIFSTLDYELTSQIEEAMINYQNPQIIDLTSHLIKYLKFVEDKDPEQVPIYPGGSAKQLTQSKLVFKKLEKDWLMPIPEPILHKNLSSIYSKINDSIDQSQQNMLSYRQTYTNNDSFQKYNEVQDNLKENYKDPYFVGECYQEPSITIKPITFQRNVKLEYDSWSNRVFQKEFEQIKLEYPQKKLMNLKKKYKIFSKPETRPYVKNVEEMIFKQDVLLKMIQDSLISKKQQQYNQYISQSLNLNPYYDKTSQYLNQPGSHRDYSNNQQINYNTYSQQSINIYSSDLGLKTSNNQLNPANSYIQQNQNRYPSPLTRNFSQNKSRQTHEETYPQRYSLLQLKTNNVQNISTTTQNQTDGINNNFLKNQNLQQNRNSKEFQQHIPIGTEQYFGKQQIQQPLQQNPLKYNNKIFPQSLEQDLGKKSLENNQIIPATSQTPKNNENKRINIFQSNQINPKIQQIPNQKENISYTNNNENVNNNNIPFTNIINKEQNKDRLQNQQNFGQSKSIFGQKQQQNDIFKQQLGDYQKQSCNEQQRDKYKLNNQAQVNNINSKQNQKKQKMIFN